MIEYLIITPLLSIMWSLPSAIIWFIPLFILYKIIGVNLRKIKDQSSINRLSRHIWYSTMIDEGEKPKGLFFGNLFIGYIHDLTGFNEKGSSEMLILSTKSIYEKLIASEIKVSNEKHEEIIIWGRVGSFYNSNYLKRIFNVTMFKPKDNQQQTIQQINDFFKIHNHIVVYLHGKPGTGKSMVGILLAKELKGTLCKSWKPTDPGDTLEKIYSHVSPTQEKPLILVLEEFDITIRQIHDDNIQIHKNIPIPVKNKNDWNSMLDDIDIGLYPYLILVLTSNLGPDKINEMDPSYIRKGRVNLINELKIVY